MSHYPHPYPCAYPGGDCVCPGGPLSENPAPRRNSVQDMIDGGIASITELVGTEFALAAYPGRKFRISRQASYWSEHEMAVLFYTQVFDASSERWLDFVKGTLSELRREVRRL